MIGRPSLSERIEFRAVKGTSAAVEARALPGEAFSDLWRRMVREWLATPARPAEASE
jgi:hypothetical protein